MNVAKINFLLGTLLLIMINSSTLIIYVGNILLIILCYF